MRLTKAVIEAARHYARHQRAHYLWDDQVRGFGVRLYPSGTKSFVVTYYLHGCHSPPLPFPCPPDLLYSRARVVQNSRIMCLMERELVDLIAHVFKPGPEDRSLVLFVDLPDPTSGRGMDGQEWRARRALAGQWRDRLVEAQDQIGLEVALFVFRNTGDHNLDLPGEAWAVPTGEPVPATTGSLAAAEAVPMESLFEEYDIIFALTEFSATAPLKVAARRHRFRAATAAGFSSAMLPALNLDIEEVDRRVRQMAALLDQSTGADFTFEVLGVVHRLHLDLRFRSAHASSGLLWEPGQVGNVPSGEAYIVPYEGEDPSEPSRSSGVLPVELDGEVVLYRVHANRAVTVLSEGEVSLREAERLHREPAYGNLAELGLGVLADMGIAPIGSILLDEKLGLHLAFGRSDHFGGMIGPESFRSPKEAVHIDRIYLPVLQPQVKVVAVSLQLETAETVKLMRDGRYVAAFK